MTMWRELERTRGLRDDGLNQKLSGPDLRDDDVDGIGENARLRDDDVEGVELQKAGPSTV